MNGSGSLQAYMPKYPGDCDILLVSDLEQTQMAGFLGTKD